MTPQSATSLRQPPRLSALALPDLGAERFSAIAKEMLPLMRRHHDEAGLEQKAIPFDPDWDRLFMLEQVGIIYLTTARVDGLLVGYALSQVGMPLWHAGSKAAHLEIIYLEPAFREGWAGYRLLKEHISGLRQAAVRVIKAETPERVVNGRGLRLDVLLRRCGMKEIERVFYMLLE